MVKRIDVKLPIPKGWRIIFHEMEVAGVGYRLGASAKLFRGKPFEVVFEREPDNVADSNAVKIIGIQEGWFGKTKRQHVGYVPKEIAKQIVESGLIDDLAPRFRTVWLGDSGHLKIYMDIIGPKELYSKFHD